MSKVKYYVYMYLHVNMPTFLLNDLHQYGVQCRSQIVHHIAP